MTLAVRLHSFGFLAFRYLKTQSNDFPFRQRSIFQLLAQCMTRDTVSNVGVIQFGKCKCFFAKLFPR